MSKIDDLRERLVVALVQSAHAERVWRRAMAHDARPENEGADDLDARLRLDICRETVNAPRSTSRICVRQSPKLPDPVG